MKIEQLLELVNTVPSVSDPVEVFSNNIILACADNVPHLYESIKQVACKFSRFNFDKNQYNSICSVNPWESIFEKSFNDLLSRKLILQSPKSGRYFGNDGKSEFRDWALRLGRNPGDHNKSIFPQDEEKPRLIDYIEIRKKKIYNTDSLSEEKKYLTVHKNNVEYVRIIEIVDEQLFIGSNETGLTLPYYIKRIKLVN